MATYDRPGGVEDPLAEQRKRLRFRSWHRGTKEINHLLGTFADDWIERLDAGQLARYEALLENSDPDLYDWITARAPPPSEFDDLLVLMRSVQGKPVTT
ncbi:MAG: succinate dehydrogenase assembly factor 2 [Alphaproteobacteria bacterium]|nr:succinate dehydrogenase assembly factor 2 [Alphaproteobacteria bacterium]